MKLAIVVIVIVAALSANTTHRVYIPTVLRESPHVTSVMGPCGALDCIQGYP